MRKMLLFIISNLRSLSQLRIEIVLESKNTSLQYHLTASRHMGDHASLFQALGKPPKDVQVDPNNIVQSSLA